MADLNSNRLIITLNTNGLNKPIKRPIVRVDLKTWPNYTLSLWKLVHTHTHTSNMWHSKICYMNLCIKYISHKLFYMKIKGLGKYTMQSLIKKVGVNLKN